ncbi:helix-turn-helix domain-containing protein [Streptomyces sp. t39]|uniref:helix-turn-helix domain-containing protein n=1 Tax=Streptomyces sp. t39 TaxID=1828156 RepID=UPI0011CE78D8|nr:helix-turn-helix transcriptional regulator [Streptomyces sp. t39]TXS39716.1 XRE family transcriptional regulator [Streptomyces sp. t39]
MPGPKDLDPSTSPRALLGAELRHARIKAGLTQDELGEPLFVSGSYIGQMEAGTRRILREHAVRLDEVLGTADFFTRNCEVSSKSRYPDHFAEAAEAETTATSIMESSTLLIPGLLQTEAYARAVFRAYQPTAPEDSINRMIDARLARARLLENPTKPLIWVVLDEAVLHRKVGGPEVMAEALAHVAELARRHRIIAQVLPFDVGAHAAMTSAIKLMSFADAPPLAYLDSPYTGRLLDDPASVARHQLTYDLIRATALSPKASLALISSTAEGYAHEAQQP